MRNTEFKEKKLNLKEEKKTESNDSIDVLKKSNAELQLVNELEAEESLEDKSILEEKPIFSKSISPTPNPQ